MTPSLEAAAPGSSCQLAIRQPAATRWPRSRTPVKSRPSFRRMVLGRRSEGRWPAIAESDRSQALAAGATAISQNGPPATSGTAAQKAVLPFAANLRWLVLTFHAMIPFSFRWSKPPCPDAEHGRRAARFHGVRELINEGEGVKDGRGAAGPSEDTCCEREYVFNVASGVAPDEEGRRPATRMRLKKSIAAAAVAIENPPRTDS